MKPWTGSVTSLEIDVALLVSAWIEIRTTWQTVPFYLVALLVSAWIEIEHLRSMYLCLYSRTPRECVD